MTILKDLLKLGQLSQIKIADSREIVHATIGSGDGDYRYQGTSIEKRGAFQFEYKNEILDSITWILANDSPSNILVDDSECELAPATNLYDFLDYCDRSEIPWRVEPQLSFDRQLCIRTAKDVVVMFDLDPREMQKIRIG